MVSFLFRSSNTSLPHFCFHIMSIGRVEERQPHAIDLFTVYESQAVSLYLFFILFFSNKSFLFLGQLGGNCWTKMHCLTHPLNDAYPSPLCTRGGGYMSTASKTITPLQKIQVFCLPKQANSTHFRGVNKHVKK